MAPFFVGMAGGGLNAITGAGVGFVMVLAMLYKFGSPTAVVVGAALFQSTTNQAMDIPLALLDALRRQSQEPI